MADLERIYDLLQRQGETLARIDQSQQDTRERLFGANGQPGALHFLQNEITKTNAVVAKHSKQIAFWRGAVTMLGIVWTALVALGATILKHR